MNKKDTRKPTKSPPWPQLCKKQENRSGRDSKELINEEEDDDDEVSQIKTKMGQNTSYVVDVMNLQICVFLIIFDKIDLNFKKNF